jgi:hypothetical protein
MKKLGPGLALLALGLRGAARAETRVSQRMGRYPTAMLKLNRLEPTS